MALFSDSFVESLKGGAAKRRREANCARSTSDVCYVGCVVKRRRRPSGWLKQVFVNVKIDFDVRIGNLS